jgi:hypothetical protein
MHRRLRVRLLVVGHAALCKHKELCPARLPHVQAACVLSTITRVSKSSEGLPCSPWERFLRQVATSFLSFVLVMIATALIAAINSKHLLFPVSRAPSLKLLVRIPSAFLSSSEPTFSCSFYSAPLRVRTPPPTARGNREAAVVLLSRKAVWPHWFADGDHFLFL